MSDQPSLLPPAPGDSLEATLRLALVPGVGPLTRKALLEHFGSSTAVLAAAPSELRRVPGVGPQLTHCILSAGETVDVEAELQVCREHGVTILTDSDPEYPRLLKEIHNPPAVLFVRGELKPDDAMAIAIVGTRHATSYGRLQAR